MSDLTKLIEVAQKGDRQAAADLLPLLYDELRKLAAAKMAGEAPGHTLDATALVHEAYMRLVGNRPFADRHHFFRVAADLDQSCATETAYSAWRGSRAGATFRRGTGRRGACG